MPKTLMLICLCVLSMLCVSTDCISQKVTIVDHPSLADEIVYVSDSKYGADLKVMVVDSPAEAQKNGYWYFTKKHCLGCLKVYFTKKRSLATMVVQFVSKAYLVGEK